MYQFLRSSNPRTRETRLDNLMYLIDHEKRMYERTDRGPLGKWFN